MITNLTGQLLEMMYITATELLLCNFKLCEFHLLQF